MSKKISHFAEIILGYAFRGAIEVDMEGKTSLIQAKNIVQGQNVANTQDLTPISFEGTRTSSFLEKNDILVVSRWTGMGSFRSAVSDIDQPNVIASSSLIIVRIKDSTKIIPEYLCLYLNSPEGQSKIINTVSGSYIQAISRRKFEDVEIPIPPLKTQIALAKLHSNIREQERIYNRKKELKQNILTATLKKLTHS
jgi:restriction endonuclease S subunit